MEPFSIYTLLTKSDYIKLLYGIVYKDTNYLIATGVGLFFAGSQALQYFHILDIYNSFSIIRFLLGCFFLLYPHFIIFRAYRRVISNGSWQESIQTTFSEDSIVVKIFSNELKFDWNYIIKYKERGDYLLLYSNKRAAFIIKADQLTIDEKNFIKQKIGVKK